MYITTFYSFKGGVGRTLALVNVAAELAQQGQRVLIVDFDLEAPGLDTFDLGRPKESLPGIVDFVKEYLDTGLAPDAEKFFYRSPTFDASGGGLWVTPAGSQDSGYAARLASIDWNDLYKNHDGYLLFEDLKLQWQAAIEPDYVLLDSRTGHTDVGGICTRHLPDAVVVLFFPNEQNLRGLTKVVRDIRAERTGPRQKQIDLHFVLSNVPDLDDEDAILEEMIGAFKTRLGFEKPPLTIHRYPSLSLLRQEIFTTNRPRTRLAREYDQLAFEIVRLNPLDRVGAFSYIDNCEPRRFGSDAAQDEQLKQIRQHHAGDGEVLYHLGHLRARSGDLDEALGLFDQAIEAGYEEPEVFLERAEQRRLLDDPNGASQDALALLGTEGLTYLEVRKALRLLLPADLKHVPTSDGLRELASSERIAVAMSLTRRPEEAAVARAVLSPLLNNADLEPAEQTLARHGLVLALLALGDFKDAVALCRTSALSVDRMSVQDAFNLGMALWGEERKPSPGPFARVVEVHASDQKPPTTANYAQCLALARWALGELDAAKDEIAEAKARVRAEPASFSCWRYLTVPRLLFTEDLDEMYQLIEGDETVTPRFMRHSRNVLQESSSIDERVLNEQERST